MHSEQLTAHTRPNLCNLAKQAHQDTTRRFVVDNPTPCGCEECHVHMHEAGQQECTWSCRWGPVMWCVARDRAAHVLTDDARVSCACSPAPPSWSRPSHRKISLIDQCSPWQMKSSEQDASKPQAIDEQCGGENDTASDSDRLRRAGDYSCCMSLLATSCSAACAPGWSA
jgi:hypothetical protein